MAVETYMPRMSHHNNRHGDVVVAKSLALVMLDTCLVASG